MAAGINVWTTLNVQHIESLNDVIAQITGVAVKETLPDTVLERADEVELIDITPDKLMERLTAGKIYIPAQAERASSISFRRGISSRCGNCRFDRPPATCSRTSRLPAKKEPRYRLGIHPSGYWCVLVQVQRMRESFAPQSGWQPRSGAEWLAVAVNTGAEHRHPAAAVESTARNLRLAETLGADTQTLVGSNVAETLLDFARVRNVTKIVAGKTAQTTLETVVRENRG